MSPGDKNAYVCEACGGHVVTVDVDEGVTPMFLSCRATPGCGGKMTSQMYRLTVLADEPPTHEWYRPSVKWARRKGPEVLDHVRRGGLVLREIKQPTRKA